MVDAPSNWAKLIDFEDDLLWYGLDKRYQFAFDETIQQVNEIDLTRLMSADDAFLYIENYTPDADIVLSSGMSDAEKNAAKIEIAHSPRHAYYMERTCQIRGLFCEVYTERTQQYVRGDMVQFFSDYLR